MSGSLTNGYAYLYINGGCYAAHRIAWKIEFSDPGAMQVDHINHIRNDNRISNLRLVTNKDNCRNISISKRSKTGFVGVLWRESAKRFRSNMNLDLPASASFFDFSASNFASPSTLVMDGAIVTRDGAFNSSDPNITPNITESALACDWSGNTGMPNTFEGGSIGVTTEAETTIVTQGAFVDLVATLWTSQDLQHFDNPSGNQMRHIGNSPREYKVIADFAIDSAANNVLSLRLRKWDDSLSSATTVLEQSRQVNNLVGGRDVAFFNMNINVELDQNDYVFLEIANETSTTNVTAETDSYYIVEQR